MRTHSTTLTTMLLSTLVLMQAFIPISTASASEAERPIIAGLMANADAYDGKPVIIYGLVIESRNGGREFVLQDVSQMPLQIIGREGVEASVGDELLIRGIFHQNGGGPYIEAQLLIPTKVVGGGCC